MYGVKYGRGKSEMWIKLQTIDELYRTQDGTDIRIRITEDGKSRMSVFDSEGKCTYEREYGSRRGAMIGMGKRFGVCRFKGMAHVYKKREA